jgi:hypothetical protein
MVKVQPIDPAEELLVLHHDLEALDAKENLAGIGTVLLVVAVVLGFMSFDRSSLYIALNSAVMALGAGALYFKEYRTALKKRALRKEIQAFEEDSHFKAKEERLKLKSLVLALMMGAALVEGLSLVL